MNANKQSLQPVLAQLQPSIPNANLAHMQEQGLRDVVFYKMANQTFFHSLLRISLYQCDFGTASVVGFGKDEDIVNLFKGFLDNIGKEVRKRNTAAVSKKHLFSLIDVSRQILNLKSDISARLITYDNVSDMFTNVDPQISAFLKSVSNDRITDPREFESNIDDLIHTVQVYNEMMTLDSVLMAIDHLKNVASSEDFSILNVAQEYKDTILEAYNTLSTLTTIAVEESLSDFLIFKDSESVTHAVADITSFLSTSFNHYKTGYALLDNNIDGLETSSVHIIAGPSNHAKSIYMLNIVKGMIKTNLRSFEDNSAIVFITLEDDIHKLLRRIISIFGSYDTVDVKNIFRVLSTYFQEQNKKDKVNIEGDGDEGILMLNRVITDAIVGVTGSKISFIIKHCNENSFSMRDGTRFIDKLQLEGLKVKALFIDYLDVMKSSSSKYDSYKDDYNLHGEILQEMRTAARNYAMPIVTITQNSRISENTQQELSNSVIGDSYKKVRYADYIYMIRQRPDIDVISDQIKNDMSGDSTVLNMSTDLSRLVPFEVKITKAKDGNRDVKKIHIFSKQTLGIYDDYVQLLQDKTKAEQLSISMAPTLNSLDSGPSISDSYSFTPVDHDAKTIIDSLVL